MDEFGLFFAVDCKITQINKMGCSINSITIWNVKVPVINSVRAVSLKLSIRNGDR